MGKNVAKVTECHASGESSIQNIVVHWQDLHQYCQDVAKELQGYWCSGHHDHLIAGLAVGEPLPLQTSNTSHETIHQSWV